VPYPKAPRRLPIILTREEAIRLIDSASNLFHRAMLITLYSTGMRRAELCHLKVGDIDSKRMLIRIQQGKSGKDRDVPLSPKALETLREYWRWMKPKTYLFPGTINGSRADKPITPKVLWEACREAAQRAGITKAVRPHLLRHASAYYTTFQSPFILKTIDLGRGRSVEVYGHRAGPLSPVPAQPAETSLFSR
jgi:integrase/recombinase XerD